MMTREIALASQTAKPLGDVVEFLDHKRRPVKEAERNPGEFPYYGANGKQGTIDGYIFDEPLILMAEDGGFFDRPARGSPIKFPERPGSIITHTFCARKTITATSRIFVGS